MEPSKGSSWGYCWVRQVKVLRWLKSLFPEWISSNMRSCTNAALADMHFMYGVSLKMIQTQLTYNCSWACQRTTLIICFSQCSFFYNLNSAIYFSDSITPRSSKWSLYAHLPMKILKCFEIQQIPTVKTFLLHPLRNRSIFLYSPMHEMQFGKPKYSLNASGVWQTNSVMCFYELNSIALSSDLTLHLCTHISAPNLLY